MTKTISKAKLQREAISIFKRLLNGDKSIKTAGTNLSTKCKSIKYPDLDIIYLFDFEKRKKNWIAIFQDGERYDFPFNKWEQAKV